MKLVIVESPTKARTISKFLGRAYKVKSSYGHVRDLPTREMGIDIENGFIPKYTIPKKAKPVIAELKDLAKEADQIILATDEDREGEAIAWHLAQILELEPENPKSQISNPKQIQNSKFKIKKSYERIVFHEITKPAIEKALEKPRSLDINLIDAQQARRILDRLVGYELSPFLWKKIRRGLSAGRVQSVALRLIVEREREIEKFKAEEYWLISARLKKTGDPQEFAAALSEKSGEKIEEPVTLKLFAGDYKTRKSLITDKASADKIAEDLKAGKYAVEKVEAKETLRTPPPPFTTSTLQQAAINKLGFSAKQTMMIAQKLYEEGHITYMRTDSTNLSLESMIAAKKIIGEKFGSNYFLENPRFYKTKSKGAQEAHEAIRPAYPDKVPNELESKLDLNQLKLYSLIWQRMVACQMQPAIFNSVRIDISAQAKEKYLLKANGSTIKFDGYLRVYNGQAPVAETMLPKLREKDALELLEIIPEQKLTTVPPRYTEAGLVKVLEENGIGRPSTYAPTISTIIDRKYVDFNEEKKLLPLEVGLLVNDMLVEHFPEIVNINFTATIEKDFDEIAEGQREWVPVIKEFYKPFHAHLKTKHKEVAKKQEVLDKKCPECGGDLVMKYGRFGKFIACLNFPNCRYTEKTAQEKKEDLEHSGLFCDLCGAPMVVKRGKFGAFLGCSRYPECKNIKKIEKKLGIKCPKCDVGEIIEKKSKRGRLFFGCSNYPKCDFALWSKPTGEKCPTCSSLLVFAAKDKVKCSNKDCGFEK